MSLSSRPWGRNYTLDDIASMPVPQPTKTYTPVPQATLYKMWSTDLAEVGYNIQSEEHWASNDKDEFISIVTVGRPNNRDGVGEWSWQAALINSYNKQVSIRTAVGASVFVCTNGCLSAEFAMRAKHTTHVWDRIEGFIARSVDNMSERLNSINRLFLAYKAADASSDRQVEHVICRAYKSGIIPASGIGQVLDHWWTPEHPEFKDRNVWSLYNAFTSYDRGRSLFQRTSRVNRLHALLEDEFAIGEATPQRYVESRLEN